MDAQASDTRPHTSENAVHYLRIVFGPSLVLKAFAGSGDRNQ